MKQYLKNLEELLIEEGCHTADDAQAFKKLLELVERDEPKAPWHLEPARYCAACKKLLGHKDQAEEYTYCPHCGQCITQEKK